MPRANRFFGRQRELDRLRALLAMGSRVVTITGTGGVGKTRFAHELARERAGLLGFCDLTETRTLEGLCASVARVIDVPVSSGHDVESAIRQIGHALDARSRQGDASLLVLDNLEQLVPEAARALAAWIEAAQRAQFICTSRERLLLPDEVLCELAPLPVPDVGADPLVFPSVQLFLDRSARDGKTPAWSARELEAISEIVRRLEGIPLAIELAAARMEVLAPAQLLDRLGKRFEVVSAVTHGGPQRQTTLRAAIGRSWDLLDAAEKEALVQCAVFRGGFTVDAAESVLSAPPGRSVLDLVQRLRIKSLARTCDTPGIASERRLALYESVREFVSEAARPEQLAEASARHALHFARAGIGWAEAAATHRGAEAMRCLETETDNITAALEWALRASSVEHARTALEAALALEPVYVGRLPLTEYQARLDLTLDRAGAAPDAPPRLLARALVLRGKIHTFAGRPERAKIDFERALATAEACADGEFEATALALLANAFAENGEIDEARPRHERALEVARRARAPAAQVVALNGLAFCAQRSGQTMAAVGFAEEALRLVEELGDEPTQARLDVRIGGLRMALGESDAARRHYESALEIAQRRGLSRVETLVAGNLAALALDTRDLEEAESACLRTASMARRIGSVDLEGMISVYLGITYLELRRPDARAAFERGIFVLRDAGYGLFEGLALAGLGAVCATQGEIGAAKAAFDAAGALLGQGGSLLSSVAEVLRGLLDLAHADAALAEGDDRTAETLRDAAMRRVTAARSQDGAEPAAAKRSELVRAAVRVLQAAVAARPPIAAALIVASDGSWFRPPRGARTELTRSPVSRLLLLELLKERLVAPGRAVSRVALAAAAWPGQDAAAKALRPRLNVAISALRKMGLEGLLLSRASGWMLDPEVVARRVDAASG